jgi:hypothetical protein
MLIQEIGVNKRCYKVARIMTVKFWDNYLGPYYFNRACFGNKSRIENWIQETRGAIQICPIDLGFAEGYSECNNIKASTYLYLIGHKLCPVNWRDRGTYFQRTATILDLSRFRDFDEYAKTVSRKSKGNDNRSVKKAVSLGYRVRIIDHDAYQGSIDRIRRSKLIRTGGLVLDAIRPRTKIIDSSEKTAPTPHCESHWSVCWGAFKGETLVAYALLTRCGDIIRTTHIMGHRDVLREGVIKLLMFDIVRQLYGPKPTFLSGIRYFMYGALEHGRDGLFQWKSRLQFHPSLLDISALYVNNLPTEFDGLTYLDLNPDVKKAKVDARLHYMIWGKYEGRRYRRSY